jgi:plasmid stability protein
MPDVLVRDVDVDILEKLKKRAAEHGRSLQSEVRSIISEHVKASSSVSDAKVAKKIRDSLRNGRHSDSARLLREDRAR